MLCTIVLRSFVRCLTASCLTPLSHAHTQSHTVVCCERDYRTAPNPSAFISISIRSPHEKNRKINVKLNIPSCFLSLQPISPISSSNQAKKVRTRPCRRRKRRRRPRNVISEPSQARRWVPAMAMVSCLYLRKKWRFDNWFLINLILTNRDDWLIRHN